MSEFNEIVMGAIRERSTVNAMMAPNPPKISRGKEKVFQFEVGQTVIATATSTLKAGTKIVIQQRYKQNGYCYYVGENWQVHRQSDIESLDGN